MTFVHVRHPGIQDHNRQLGRDDVGGEGDIPEDLLPLWQARGWERYDPPPPDPDLGVPADTAGLFTAPIDDPTSDPTEDTGTPADLDNPED